MGSLFLAFVIFIVAIIGIGIPLIALYFIIKLAVKKGILEAMEVYNRDKEN